MTSKIVNYFLNSDINIVNIEKLNEYVVFCLDNDIDKIKNKTELHHILPKSIFPEFENLNIHKWNGVNLTYESHYLAHCLLIEGIDNYNMNSAWSIMNFCNPKLNKINNPEYLIGPKRYALLRENWIKSHIEHLTKEFIKDGNVTTLAKENGKKSSNTVKKEFIKDGKITTISKERAKLNSKTVKKEYIDEQGTLTSIAKERAIISSDSMKKEFIKDGKITTLAKERGKISSMSMKKEFIKDGKITNTYKESGKKGSNTLNKEFIKDGEITTIAKERAKNNSILQRTKGKKWDLYHVDIGLLKKNVPNADIIILSQTLIKRTKNNYLGRTTASKKSLIKKGKILMIGLYTIQSKENK